MAFTEAQRTVLTQVGVKDVDAAERAIEESNYKEPILANIARMMSNPQSTGTTLRALLENTPGVDLHVE